MIDSFAVRCHSRPSNGDVCSNWEGNGGGVLQGGCGMMWGRRGGGGSRGVLDAFGLLSVQQHHSAVQSLILGTATPVDHRPSAGRVKLEFRDWIDQINPVTLSLSRFAQSQGWMRSSPRCTSSPARPLRPPARQTGVFSYPQNPKVSWTFWLKKGVEMGCKEKQGRQVFSFWP